MLLESYARILNEPNRSLSQKAKNRPYYYPDVFLFVPVIEEKEDRLSLTRLTGGGAAHSR